MRLRAPPRKAVPSSRLSVPLDVAAGEPSCAPSNGENLANAGLHPTASVLRIDPEKGRTITSLHHT